MNAETARSIIENQKQQQGALLGVTSKSRAGVWVQISFIYASVAEWMFSQWETFREELEDLVNTRRWATAAWYIERAKAFQRGDMLELLPNGQFGYAKKDESKYVIRQAAIEVADRELRFKVATEENGELSRVSDADMAMFKSYINQIKRPGTPIRFINYDADLIRINLRVYFDGELYEDTVRGEVTGKVKGYLKDIVFNGVFSVTKLIDEVQTVKGVNECVWLSGGSWLATESPSAAKDIIDRHRSASGYFKVYKDTGNVEHLNLELHREL